MIRVRKRKERVTRTTKARAVARQHDDCSTILAFEPRCVHRGVDRRAVRGGDEPRRIPAQRKYSIHSERTDSWIEGEKRDAGRASALVTIARERSDDDAHGHLDAAIVY